MSTVFYSHPDCRTHDMGAGHPECPERLDAIEDRLRSSGLALERREPTLASLADISAEISAEMVSKVAGVQGTKADAKKVVTDIMKKEAA